MRYILVAADSHCGHKLGLCSPDTILTNYDVNGQEKSFNPVLTATQKWLWSVYTTGIQEVKNLKNLHVIHLGDVCQGLKHPEQIMTTRLSDQIEIATTALHPLLDLQPQSLRVSYGTVAHCLTEESAEILVLNQLKKEYPQVNIAGVSHGLGQYGKAAVDYAHHGPSVGGQAWLGGNALRNYVKSLLLQGLSAQVVLRGHYHQFCHETVRVGDSTVEALIAPALCGLSGYAVQATKSQPKLTVGLVLLEIKGLKINVIPLMETLDLRTKEQF